MSDKSLLPAPALWSPPLDRTLDAASAGKELNLLRDAARTLRRHKLLFCSIFFAICSLGLAAALVLPPVYSASSSVLIETSDKDVVTLKEVLAGVPADAEAIAGELEFLSSRELLEAVANRLHLLQNPEFNPSLRPSRMQQLIASAKAWLHARLGLAATAPPDWQPRPMNQVVDALRQHLLIAPVGRSRVIRITCTSRDPETAAAVVNTLAEFYTEEHLHMRDEATRQANDWISARLAELRARTDRSARAVEQYRISHGLVRGRDSLLIQQQLTEASTQLSTARAHVAEAEATLADAERAVASGRPQQIAAVLSSPVIQLLREQEARIVAKRADLDSNLGSAHPQARAINAQLRGLQGQIGAEVGRVVQSLREAVRVAKANAAVLAAHFADVRRQADEANTHDVGLQDLQREADVDNALYQTFLTRAKQTEPDVTFRSINVRVFSRAVPPDRPVMPNRKMIAIAGMVLGLIGGFGAVLARDLVTKGLRTRADVERLIGAPLLGAIPYCPKRSRPIESLRLLEAVASLWARIIVSVGSTPKSLVVTSAVMREGKTTLARLLATVAAEQGQRVLLIDADLRCSSLTARVARAGALPGLAEVIRGEAALVDVTVAQDRNIHLLPAGHCQESPVRLFASENFAKVLRDAERHYDVVIVDSPPILIGADSWLLGRSAEATILVARWGQTARQAVEEAMRQLADVGVRCTGLVLSAVNVSRVGLYDDATTLAVSARARPYYENLLARK